MKICIIKLGALGDVVRTIPIVKAIKEHNPEAEITWITKPNILDILKTYSFIDEVKPLPFEKTSGYDILYNFDIDDTATQLASSITANKKLGFYAEDGYPVAFNLGAEYYLNTLFDDEIKKSNRKTYQEMMFMAAELPYKKILPKLNLPEKYLDYAEEFAEKNSIKTENLVGIHVGADSRWPSKAWHEESIKEFIKIAQSEGYQIILFGGPNEIDKLSRISNELNVVTNNPRNSNLEFASLVNLCNFMVCSDSFALHLSLALKKPTLGLFFVTSPYEVESYNLLKKIISPRLNEFFPERMNEYNEELVKSITAEDVFNALKSFS